MDLAQKLGLQSQNSVIQHYTCLEKDKSVKL